LKSIRHSPKALSTSGLPAPKVRPKRSGPLHVEVISVGRELLRGQVADLNAKTIAEFVSRRGGLVHRMTVVDDNARAIAGAVREALIRNPHLVVTSGGLGPASDDLTLSGVAEVLGQPLSMNQQARKMVEEAYLRLQRARQVGTAALNPAREKMCKIPVGSQPIPNEIGIAPGVICKLPGGAAVVCLPGLPDEMRHVLDNAVRILQELTTKVHTAKRELEAPTPDESSLSELIKRLASEFPGLWISSRTLRAGRRGVSVVVTLEATASTIQEANAVVSGAQRRLLTLAGEGH
jgi:molybdenum cofactor synthesis domain-containing protein